MRTGRPKAITYAVSDERTRPFGHNAIALAARGTDVAGESVLAGLCGEPAEQKAHRAVRLGQDDRRTCAAHASGRREARLQVHPDDGRLQSDPPTKTHRSPSMSGNRTSETLGIHQ